MTALYETADLARKTGVITLAALRELLARDIACPRRMLEHLYEKTGCRKRSGAAFGELVEHARVAGDISVDRVVAGSDGAEPSSVEYVWRSAVWYWLLLCWAGIPHHLDQQGPGAGEPVLKLYCRTSAGRHEVIGSTYSPNWHHSVKLDELQGFFHARELALPRLLERTKG
ncbi:MAG: hypothetical protein GY868_08760 [Deltaproteobacteria bacterium]|nr:hypothetical protein [Deltaproteobacteria bacterium]